MTRRDYAVPTLLGVGVLLLAASVGWSRMKDPRVQWTEADARQRTAAGAAVHQLVCEMDHKPPGAEQEAMVKRLEAASQEYAAADQRLDDARERFDRPARWFRWAGWTSLALGIVVYYALRPRTA